MNKIERVTLAHGSGGEPSQKLIKELFLKEFNNPFLSPLTDSAILTFGTNRIAFTTDSYVVKPLFFSGGDIGKLAVAGTINDLSVTGARPLFISCGLIIEEGFEYKTLEKIILSMKKTALEAGVQIVTGDTKVVEKGAADKIYINTAGIGLVMDGIELQRERIKDGDSIIINGTIGDHGISVL